MYCLYFLVISLVLSQLLSLSCAYKNATWLQVDEMRYNFLEVENSLWNLTVNGLLRKRKEKGEMYLIKKFGEIDHQLQKLPSDLLLGMDPLKRRPNFLFLYNNLGNINLKYTKFRHYLQQRKLDSQYKIYKEDIIYDVLNNETGINIYMSAIYKLAYGPHNSLFDDLIERRGWDMWFALSPRQAYYHLYNLISLNALKAYILEQFAYLARNLNKGHFVQQSENARKMFEQNTLNVYQQLIKTEWHSYQLITSNPSTFIKGTNYDEFTRLVQGRIEQENELHPKGFCHEDCNAYSSDELYHRPSCPGGKLYNCFFYDTYLEGCLSGSASRRYDYIRSENTGKVLGRYGSCNNKTYLRFWSWWIFFRCDYCLCLCDESGPNSDRYISLRSVKSDVKQNMVVTGLRFVKYNRILHLQIQEGKLIPYGQIDQASVRWKPVDNFKITDYGVARNRDYFEMDSTNNRMTLNEPTAYGLNFHVVTGLSFYYIGWQVRLRIYVTPFDWRNATLYTSQTQEIYKLHEQWIEQPIDLGVPTRTSQLSSYHVWNTNYVKFTHTSWSGDAAQTTIPFIDMQSVYSKPAVPLKGAGIFYKGGHGYGGFVAPMIKTYEHLNLLSSKMPTILYRFNNSTVKKPIQKKRRIPSSLGDRISKRVRNKLSSLFG